MNRLSLIALSAAAAVVALAAAPAHAALGAGEGVAGYPHEMTVVSSASSLSRAEVRAQAALALAEGRIAGGEVTPVAEADRAMQPVLTRVQVRAQAGEAVRLGLVAGGETTAVYTAPQLAALQAVVERADSFVVAGQR